MIVLWLIFSALLFAFLGVLLWPVRRRKVFCAGVAAVFFIAAFGLYAWLGAADIVALGRERDAKMAELTRTIIAQSQEVKLHPQNAAAWAELGKSFMVTGQFSAAENAYKQAVIASHGAPELILAYGEAQIYAADGKVTDGAKKAMQMVLAQQQENPEARYFLIVRQLQDGKTKDAMKAMKALYRSLPADSPLKGMIDKQIGK